MIAVVGEALVDLVVDPDDPRHPVAHPGGSPANVAVALARLGTPVCFVGRSGTDAFGDLMRSHLAGNGVDLSHVVAAAEPSSVAVVSLDADGTASYNFHVAGTADWSWAGGELPATLPAETAAIHTGSLALATAPGGVVIEDWLAPLRERHTISVDPNVRPALVGPRQDYQRRLAHWLHLADIVKVSSEDLDWIYPGADPVAIAQRWLEIDGGPTLVVITFGAHGSAVCLAGQVNHRSAPAVEVTDTVGAGDAFSGGLLHWLTRHGRLRRDALRALTSDEATSAVDFATAVAAATCARPGADPPHRHQLTEPYLSGRH